MSYDTSSSTVPAMPKPEKGTEIVELILSQASREVVFVLFRSFTRSALYAPLEHRHRPRLSNFRR